MIDFEALRHDKDHHLGLGDVRLTMDQQEEIEAEIDRLRASRDCWKESQQKVNSEAHILARQYADLKASAARLWAALRNFVAFAEANGFGDATTGRQLLLADAKRAIGECPKGKAPECIDSPDGKTCACCGCVEMCDKVERLEAALRFYAAAENWEGSINLVPSCAVFADGGEIAKKALEDRP